MIKMIYIMLLLGSFVPVYALDTLEARGGDFIYLKIEVSDNIKIDSLHRISAILEVQNRTLINPESFCDKDLNEIETSIFTEDRNTYDIETIPNVPIVLSECVYLKCRVMAGASTKTEMLLTKIKILDQNKPDQQYLLKVLFQNAPLLYIRYMYFDNVYPNPLTPGQELICEYTIDRESEVKIVLVCNNGETYTLDKRLVQKGDIKQHIPIDKKLSAGTYRVWILTNHGEASKKLMVIK